MEVIAGWFPDFVDLPSLFAFLLDATIKGTAILAIALLIIRLQKGLSSATIYSVLIIALVLCLLIPFLTVLFSQSESLSFTYTKVAQSVGFSTAGLAGETDSAGGQLVFPLWATAVILIWISGFLLLLVKLLIGHACTISFRRTASQVDDARLNAVLEECKARVGVSDRVRLLTSNIIQIPVTFGYIHPTIALPCEITERCNRSYSEISRILIHELGHIKRRDRRMRSIMPNNYWDILRKAFQERSAGP